MEKALKNYKQTSIGLIPDDWEVKKIKQIGEVSSGGTPDTTKEKYWNGDINWCTPTDITALKNKFLGNTKTKITEEGLKNSSAKILPPNSIIVCTRATIGKVAINTVPMSTNQGFKNIIPKSIDADFLYYKIVSEEHGLVRIASGSTFLEVSKTDFDNFHISVPPLLEQQKIASILSTWDIAIDNCKAIIEQLKVRNKELTRKLLTCKIRVKGYSENWKIKTLDEIGELTSSKRVYLSDYVENGIPFFRGKEISELKNGKTIKDILYISHERYKDFKIKYGVPKTNDILITAVGTLGNVYRIPDESPFYFKDGNLIWIRNIKENSIFLEFLLNFENGKIMNSAIGSSQKALTIFGLNKLKFYIPSIKEQNAISLILNKATEELNQYQRKLEVLQLQKKGLMRQLLTGKVRVKIQG